MKKIKIYLLATILLLLMGSIAYYEYFYISEEEALLNFKEITYREPLLVSPEINSEELQISVETLKLTQGKLLKELGLESEVTPTGFLVELTNVNKADKFFRLEQNGESANNLINSYSVAIDKYRLNISQAKENLEKNFPNDEERSFVNFGSTTTNFIIRDDLKLMLKNADALEKEIKRRKKILNGKSRYSPDFKKPRFFEKKSFMAPGDLSIYNNDQADISKLYLVESSCFGTSNQENIFTYVVRKSPHGEDIFLPKIANNKYYQKLSENISFEKKFIEQGIEWRPIKEGNTYRCNDLEYQAELLALVNFNNKYESNYFFKEEKIAELSLGDKDTALWKEGKDYEQRVLANKDHYYYRDLLGLADYYRYFSLFYELDSVEFMDLNKRYLFIDNKQNDIELIINTEFFYNDLRNRLRVGVIDKESSFGQYLYALRINYSFVFLNFSKAVWWLEEKPKYIIEHQKNDRFATIDELLELYTETEIKMIESVTHAETLGL